LTLDAGTFDEVEINTRNGAVRIGFSAATPHTPNARLRIERAAEVAGASTYRAADQFGEERGALVVPLRNGIRRIELRAER
jgi:hypothetical protein